ncbi:hypothetical protein X275_00625 [Marinitoga sp. 1197]|uniref:hypothetical protein n=1 Tax=Marinitoga sp. 1197 TaxID=1428449 RepID=UPI000640FF50|nr:hypothetical protein [Marinitoga sp. 1197]KLO24335.1 hypothetical protein X275_00625 [Marinitoga sp. 1197]
MIGILIIIYAIYISYKQKRESHFLIYNLLIISLIFLFGIQNYEAVYQVEPKPSDTYLYYTAFKTFLSDINHYLFYQYPLFLRIMIYPLKNAYFALYIQSNIVFLLIMLISEKLNNLYFFILYMNHTLIYTNVNFFKDNYIIIVGLLGIYLLQKIKNKIFQSVIIYISVFFIDLVRPFFKFFYFLLILPFIKNKKLKAKHLIVFYISIFFFISIIIYIYSETIFSVLDVMEKSGDSSLGFSLTSPIRSFFGPTPIRFLFHENYFEQPFLKSQGYIYYFLHIIFYFLFPVVIIIFIIDIKKYFYLNKIKTDSLFSFSISFLTFSVYQVVYGSADIRQRAIIILFFVFFVLNETDIKVEKLIDYKFIYSIFLIMEGLLSYFSL